MEGRREGGRERERKREKLVFILIGFTGLTHASRNGKV
jgi:hypothetical protein